MENLTYIYIPLSALRCTDTMFQEHTSEIQTIHDHIISFCIKGSKCSIPNSSDKSKNKVIPGGDNYVERYKKGHVILALHLET